MSISLKTLCTNVGKGTPYSLRGVNTNAYINPNLKYKNVPVHHDTDWWRGKDYFAGVDFTKTTDLKTAFETDITKWPLLAGDVHLKDFMNYDASGTKQHTMNAVRTCAANIKPGNLTIGQVTISNPKESIYWQFGYIYLGKAKINLIRKIEHNSKTTYDILNTGIEAPDDTFSFTDNIAADLVGAKISYKPVLDFYDFAGYYYLIPGATKTGCIVNVINPDPKCVLSLVDSHYTGAGKSLYDITFSIDNYGPGSQRITHIKYKENNTEVVKPITHNAYEPEKLFLGPEGIIMILVHGYGSSAMQQLVRNKLLNLFNTPIAYGLSRTFNVHLSELDTHYFEEANEILFYTSKSPRPGVPATPDKYLGKLSI